MELRSAPLPNSLAAKREQLLMLRPVLLDNVLATLLQFTLPANQKRSKVLE